MTLAIICRKLADNERFVFTGALILIIFFEFPLVKKFDRQRDAAYCVDRNSNNRFQISLRHSTFDRAPEWQLNFD